MESIGWFCLRPVVKYNKVDTSVHNIRKLLIKKQIKLPHQSNCVEYLCIHTMIMIEICACTHTLVPSFAKTTINNDLEICTRDTKLTDNHFS